MSLSPVGANMVFDIKLICIPRIDDTTKALATSRIEKKNLPTNDLMNIAILIRNRYVARARM